MAYSMGMTWTVFAITLIGCVACSPPTIDGEPLTGTDSDPSLDSGIRDGTHSGIPDTDTEGPSDTSDTGIPEPEPPVNLLQNASFEDGEEPAQ